MEPVTVQMQEKLFKMELVLVLSTKLCKMMLALVSLIANVPRFCILEVVLK